MLSTILKEKKSFQVEGTTGKGMTVIPEIFNSDETTKLRRNAMENSWEKIFVLDAREQDLYFIWRQ